MLVICFIYRASLDQMVENLPWCGVPGFNSWVRRISWRKEWLPTPVFLPGEFHGQRSLYSNDICMFKCQSKGILSIDTEK